MVGERSPAFLNMPPKKSCRFRLHLSGGAWMQEGFFPDANGENSGAVKSIAMPEIFICDPDHPTREASPHFCHAGDLIWRSRCLMALRPRVIEQPSDKPSRRLSAGGIFFGTRFVDAIYPRKPKEYWPAAASSCKRGNRWVLMGSMMNALRLSIPRGKRPSTAWILSEICLRGL